jgi:putative oligomerization/nucleic acid binding protein
MPLIRGMARTAVVAGTATAVSNRVSRRQANRWAAQEEYSPAYMSPQAPPTAYEQAPPPAAAGPDPIEQLKELGELHTAGVLTDEEFAVQKAKILGNT